MEKYLREKEAARILAEAKLKQAKEKMEADKKQRAIAQKERTKALQEKAQRCLQQAASAFKSHMEEAYDKGRKLQGKLDKAQAYRDARLDPGLRQQIAQESAQKTAARLEVAQGQQQEICDGLLQRQAEAQQRLDNKKAEIESMLEKRIQKSKEKNIQIQIQASETLAEQARERLRRHGEFEDHYDIVNKTRVQFYKERSKSVQERFMKAYSAAENNKRNNADSQNDRNEKYAQYMKKMDDRIEYVKSLKLKCGQVFLFFKI